MSASQSAMLATVEDERMKLLGVLGGLQCLRVACRNAEPEIELEAAVVLLANEVQRIVTALEDTSLLHEASNLEAAAA